MDGGAWWAAVHGVAESRTRLSDFTFTFHFHALEKDIATHSSILARIILWTQKHVGQHSAAAAAKLLQWCPTLRPHRRQPTRLPHPWDSPGKNTGEGCHFLLQCMKMKSESKLLSGVRLFATPWTAAYQAPPSMRFSRQEYWSGLPLPSPDPYP